MKRFVNFAQLELLKLKFVLRDKYYAVQDIIGSYGKQDIIGKSHLFFNWNE